MDPKTPQQKREWQDKRTSSFLDDVMIQAAQEQDDKGPKELHLGREGR